MASGAILNLVWDLMARKANKPLWLMVAEMEPEQLVQFIDFKHITEFVTKAEALELLKRVRPGWQERVERMKKVGFRAYTTSCGWLGYPEDVIRSKCREGLKQGHTYFKMKVGSRDPQEDIKRARIIREEIGEENTLMMDANQKWNVDEAISNMKELVQFRPIWIEEPTNADDVVGHAAINRALKTVAGGVCGVATGEVCANKVLFKQLLQLEAVRYVQIDSCRVAGPSEILSTLLMAAKAGVKVCPHAGGVGLCEYVRHLCMIDFICFNPVDEKDRVCESITDSSGYFYDPVVMRKGEQGLFYMPAASPGYAQMTEKTIADYSFPYGPMWKGDPKAELAGATEVENAERVLRESGVAQRRRRNNLLWMVAAHGLVASALAALYFNSKK
jgi:L-fuconate dehydratase